MATNWVNEGLNAAAKKLFEKDREADREYLKKINPVVKPEEKSGWMPTVTFLDEKVVAPAKKKAKKIVTAVEKEMSAPKIEKPVEQKKPGFIGAEKPQTYPEALRPELAPVTTGRFRRGAAEMGEQARKDFEYLGKSISEIAKPLKPFVGNLAYGAEKMAEGAVSPVTATTSLGAMAGKSISEGIIKPGIEAVSEIEGVKEAGEWIKNTTKIGYEGALDFLNKVGTQAPKIDPVKGVFNNPIVDVVSKVSSDTRVAEAVDKLDLGQYDGAIDETKKQFAKGALLATGYYVDFIERPVRKTLLPHIVNSWMLLEKGVKGQLSSDDVEEAALLAEDWAGGPMEGAGEAGKILSRNFATAVAPYLSGFTLDMKSTQDYVNQILLPTETRYRNEVSAPKLAKFYNKKYGLNLTAQDVRQKLDSQTIFGVPARTVFDTMVSYSASLAEGAVSGGLARSKIKGLETVGAIMEKIQPWVYPAAVGTFGLDQLYRTGAITPDDYRGIAERIDENDLDLRQTVDVMSGIAVLGTFFKGAGFVGGKFWEVGDLSKAAKNIEKIIQEYNTNPKAVAQELEAFQKRFAKNVSDFSEGQLAVSDLKTLEAVLESLPESFQKFAKGINFSLYYRNLVGGLLAGEANSTTKTLSLDIDTLRTPIKGGMVEAERTLPHELSHLFEKIILQDPEFGKDWQALTKDKVWKKSNMLAADSAYKYSSPREYFAEGVSEYLKTPNTLKAEDPGLFNFMAKATQEFNKLLAPPVFEPAAAMPRSGLLETIMRYGKSVNINDYDVANKLITDPDAARPTMNGVPKSLELYAKPLADFPTRAGFIEALEENKISGLPYYGSTIAETQLRLFDHLNRAGGSKYESAGDFYESVKKGEWRTDVSKFPEAKGDVYDLNKKTGEALADHAAGRDMALRMPRVTENDKDLYKYLEQVSEGKNVEEMIHFLLHPRRETWDLMLENDWEMRIEKIDKLIPQQPLVIKGGAEGGEGFNKSDVESYSRMLKEGSLPPPIIIDKDFKILDGHRRLQSYMVNKKKTIPVLQLVGEGSGKIVNLKMSDGGAAMPRLIMDEIKKYKNAEDFIKSIRSKQSDLVEDLLEGMSEDAYLYKEYSKKWSTPKGKLISAISQRLIIPLADKEGMVTIYRGTSGGGDDAWTGWTTDPRVAFEFAKESYPGVDYYSDTLAESKQFADVFIENILPVVQVRKVPVANIAYFEAPDFKTNFTEEQEVFLLDNLKTEYVDDYVFSAKTDEEAGKASADYKENFDIDIDKEIDIAQKRWGADAFVASKLPLRLSDIYNEVSGVKNAMPRVSDDIDNLTPAAKRAYERLSIETKMSHEEILEELSNMAQWGEIEGTKSPLGSGTMKEQDSIIDGIVQRRGDFMPRIKPEPRQIVDRVIKYDKFNINQQLALDLVAKVDALGLGIRDVKSFAEMKEGALKLLEDPAALLRVDPKRITDDEVVALKQLINQDMRFVEDNEKVLAKNQSVSPRELQAKIDAANNRVIKTLDLLVPGMTEQGRALVANKIFADKTLDFSFWSARARKLMGPSVKDESLTEVLKMIRQLTANKDVLGLSALMSKLEDSHWVDKVVKFWKAGLLTSPLTHIKNVGSNTAFGILESISQIPAVALDKVVAVYSGKRSATLVGFKDQFKGIPKGFLMAQDVMKYGMTMQDLGKGEIYKNVNYSDTVIGRGITKYTDFIFRLLSAEDKVFRGRIEYVSIKDQAQAIALNEGLKGKAFEARVNELVDKPTPEMLKTSEAESALGTFNNNNPISDFFLHGRQSAAPGMRLASEVIMPFTRTPTNVALRTLDYSPVGVAKGLVETALSAITKNAGLQRKGVLDFGRGVTGTGLIALGFLLAEKKMLTGTYPSEGEKKKFFRGYQLRGGDLIIGGKTYNLMGISPVGNLLQLGAAIYENVEEDGVLAGVQQASFEFGKGLTDQTFLAGLSNVLTALTDPERGAESFFSSMFAGMIPTVVGHIEEAGDAYQRDARGLFGKLIARTPGRQGIPPRFDMFGQPMETAQQAMTEENPFRFLQKAFLRMIDPTQQRELPSNEILTEYERLRALDLSPYPTIPDPYSQFTFKLSSGESQTIKFKMDNESYNLYTEILGRLMADGQAYALDSQAYQAMDDEGKAKMLEDIYGASQKAAKMLVLPLIFENNPDLYRDVEKTLTAGEVEEIKLQAKTYSDWPEKLTLPGKKYLPVDVDKSTLWPRSEKVKSVVGL